MAFSEEGTTQNQLMIDPKQQKRQLFSRRFEAAKKREDSQKVRIDIFLV